MSKTLLHLGVAKAKKKPAEFKPSSVPPAEEPEAESDGAENTNRPVTKRWVQVEVIDERTGETRMEERFYMPGGSFIRKPRKGTGHKARPKRIPELEVLLGDILSEEKNGVSAAKLILAAIRKKAIAGDVRAAELLLDRAYGKSKQEINVNKTEKQYIVIAGQKIEF